MRVSPQAWVCIAIAMILTAVLAALIGWWAVPVMAPLGAAAGYLGQTRWPSG